MITGNDNLKVHNRMTKYTQTGKALGCSKSQPHALCKGYDYLVMYGIRQ